MIRIGKILDPQPIIKIPNQWCWLVKIVTF